MEQLEVAWLSLPSCTSIACHATNLGGLTAPVERFLPLKNPNIVWKFGGLFLIRCVSGAGKVLITSDTCNRSELVINYNSYKPMVE